MKAKYERDKMDYRPFLENCEWIAKRAGGLIREKVGHVAIREKGPADLVTEADLASQELVRSMLAEIYPTHLLVGEEDSPERRADPARDPSRAEFAWIVDPIDGTTNYAHGVPFYCISLALAHRGRLVVGVVYDPNQDECFTAAEGVGAFLNGKPIHPSSVTDLEHALYATSFPAHVQKNDPDVQCFMELVGKTQSIRRTGSAALNLAYVAAGRFDVASAYKTKIWDYAAGTVLVQVAGGMILTWKGEPIPLADAPHLATATPQLAETLLRCTSKID